MWIQAVAVLFAVVMASLIVTVVCLIITDHVEVVAQHKMLHMSPYVPCNLSVFLALCDSSLSLSLHPLYMLIQMQSPRLQEFVKASCLDKIPVGLSLPEP